MTKADDLVKSITPEQLEKTRSEVHKEVRTQNEPDDCEDEKEDCAKKKEKKIDKVDLISDVQLITVGKLQGVVRLLWAAIIIVLLVLAAQVLQFARQLDLQGKFIVISESQREMLEEQKKIVEAAKESDRKVAEVKKEVSETKEQVKEAVEASPKIEIDPDSGQAKVVVPVKKGKKGTKKGDGGKKVDPKPSSPPPAPVPPPTQVELRDDEDF